MAARSIDCGFFSHGWIQSTDLSRATLISGWDGHTGDGAVIKAFERWDFHCSGVHTFDAAQLTADLTGLSGVAGIVNVGVQPVAVLPTTDFLLGLTGIVCALLIAFAFNR